VRISSSPEDQRKSVWTRFRKTEKKIKKAFLKIGEQLYQEIFENKEKTIQEATDVKVQVGGERKDQLAKK